MTVIVDTCLRRELAAGILPQLLLALKKNGNVFRNVRFNYMLWEPSGVKNRVCPMMLPMTESFYDDYASCDGDKDFGALADDLKLFHARSKLLILLTDREIPAWKDVENRRRMQPFLDKKLMIVQAKSPEEISIHYREL